MIRISRKTGDLLTTIALIAAVIFFFIETFSLAPSPVRGYPGAAFLPRLILVYAMIFLSVLLIQIFMRAPADPATDAGGFDFEVTDYVVTIAAISWFILGLSYFGFEVTSFTLIAALLIRRIGRPVLSLFSAAVATLLFWAVFVISLNVSLPLAFLPRFISF